MVENIFDKNDVPIDQNVRITIVFNRWLRKGIICTYNPNYI